MLLRCIPFLALCACATAVADGDGGGPIDEDTGTNKDSGTMLDGAQQADTNGMDTSSGNCASAFSGVLATWDFTLEPGTQASTAVKTTAPNVMASAFSRAAALTPVVGAGSINSSGWPTGGVDMTKYYAFTLTPPSGCSMDITQLAIDSQTSGTGPVSGSLATNVDNFSAMANVGLNTVAMVAPNVTGQTKAVEIRIYGYGASATGGTFRIKNTFSVTGALN